MSDVLEVAQMTFLILIIALLGDLLYKVIARNVARQITARTVRVRERAERRNAEAQMFLAWNEILRFRAVGVTHGRS